MQTTQGVLGAAGALFGSSGAGGGGQPSPPAANGISSYPSIPFSWANSPYGTGRQTVGGLIPARIYAIDSYEHPISQNFMVYCAFNPTKYTISVSSSFNIKGYNPFTMNYNIETDTKNEKPRQLKLQELWFDAYENNVQDVRPVTETLMDLAQLKDNSGVSRSTAEERMLAILKPRPAKIMFEWGAFKFRGLIKSLNIDYVMFTQTGTPVRAKASLTLVEYRHRRAFPRQNPTSGGKMTEQIWVVSGHDRLDTIAAEVYGDATRWRQIAEHNGIEDPNGLRPGQELAIPAL